MAAELNLRAGDEEWAYRYARWQAAVDEYEDGWWDDPGIRALFDVPFIEVGTGSWIKFADLGRRYLPEPVQRVEELLTWQPHLITPKLITRVMIAMNVTNTADKFYKVTPRQKVKRWLTENLGAYVMADVE